MKTYNDVFVEELVVRYGQGIILAVRLGFITVGAVLSLAVRYVCVSVLGEFTTAIFPALFALVWIGVFFACRFINLEYEYSFFSGDVDIDRIRGKRKRDTLVSFSCSEVEIMAPCGPAYDSMLQENFDKKTDARGSGKGERDWFLIYNLTDGGRGVLVFSPSDRLVGAFAQFLRGGRFRAE